MRQFRSAAHALLKAPLFSSVAVISLGLALALNTTMFALADAVLHPYVPYPHPEELVVPLFRGGEPKNGPTLDARFAAVRDGMHSYDKFAAYSFLRGVLVQTGSSSEYRWVAGVTPQFFDVLGVRPTTGRIFDDSDVGVAGQQGAVISFRLWNRLFDARPLSDKLTMEVARTRYTIIGVMPRGVHFPYDNTDIWLPANALPADSASRAIGPFPLLRLKRGVGTIAARAEVATIAARLTAQYTPKRPLSGAFVPVVLGRGSPSAFPSFIVATVVMVLIIACANLGTMLIARGVARRRETAIRIALGASQWDIICAVLSECALIVAAGVALGALLTTWALFVLPHFTPPWVADLGDLQPVPSWRVFAFALGASLATILLAGALPAWRAATTDPAEPMKEGSTSTTGRLRDRYNPLIVLEAALSTALLMCSALFVIVAVRLAAFDFRYAAKQLVTADVLPSVRYVPKGQESRFWNDLLVRAAQLPYARLAATRTRATPDGKILYAEEGKAGDTWMNANDYTVVSADYFRTMGISIVGGRDFASGDAVGALPIAVVDENAARRLWPDMPDPVGRMLKLGRKESAAPWIRVVGIAQAIEYMPRRDIDIPPEPVVYVLVPNDSTRWRQLIVRNDGVGADRGRAALALAVQQAIHEQLPSQGNVLVRPWLDDYTTQRDSTGFMASLFGAFAAFGLVLCAVGLYGVLAYTVTRRLREFAVRVALGARRRDVMRLVLHDAAVTALAGVGIGAFFALRFTWPIVDGLGATNISYAPVLALVASELVLLGVAFVAALGPVRRAAQADPLEIIRAI